MSAAFNAISKIPIPLFGTAATAFAFASKKAANSPKWVGWAVPVATGALWFVWPAVDEEWKLEVGISGSTPSVSSAEEDKIELSASALKKIENAYIPVNLHVEPLEVLREDEKAVIKAVAEGDFSLLEKEWDTFQMKASVPGDGDDDDDDDDDDVDDDNDEDEDGVDDDVSIFVFVQAQI